MTVFRTDQFVLSNDMDVVAVETSECDRSSSSSSSLRTNLNETNAVTVVEGAKMDQLKSEKPIESDKLEIPTNANTVTTVSEDVNIDLTLPHANIVNMDEMNNVAGGVVECVVKSKPEPNVNDSLTNQTMTNIAAMENVKMEDSKKVEIDSNHRTIETNTLLDASLNENKTNLLENVKTEDLTKIETDSNRTVKMDASIDADSEGTKIVVLENFQLDNRIDAIPKESIKTDTSTNSNVGETKIVILDDFKMDNSVNGTCSYETANTTKASMESIISEDKKIAIQQNPKTETSTAAESTSIGINTTTLQNSQKITSINIDPNAIDSSLSESTTKVSVAKSESAKTDLAMAEKINSVEMDTSTADNSETVITASIEKITSNGAHCSIERNMGENTAIVENAIDSTEMDTLSTKSVKILSDVRLHTSPPPPPSNESTVLQTADVEEEEEEVQKKQFLNVSYIFSKLWDFINDDIFFKVRIYQNMLNFIQRKKHLKNYNVGFFI